MRRFKDDCSSLSASKTWRQAPEPGSLPRRAGYRLISPLLAIPVTANVLREVVDYYIPIEVSKRSELVRGLRETFFSTSTMFSDDKHEYGVGFHEAIAEQGEMRKTHVFRHSAAQSYDVLIGYITHKKGLPYLLPISWTVSAGHDVLYNFVNPLIPNKTLRGDAMRLTELLRASKLCFNCPGVEELKNIFNKGYNVRYRAPVSEVHDKTLGTIVNGYVKEQKDKLAESEGLDVLVNSANSVKETASMPSEILQSILMAFVEHKYYRVTPHPVNAAKQVLDDARKKIVGEQHPAPWKKTEKVYSFLREKTRSLYNKVTTNR